MKKKVLLVDDDLFVTTLYKTKLLDEGYEVETANSGEDALSTLETLRPNVIILDLNMPGMNGVQVLRKIRERAELKTVPVIIFSNGNVQSLLDDVSPLGVEKFFTKSQCPPSRLLTEIGNTLNAQLAEITELTETQAGTETGDSLEAQVQDVLDTAGQTSLQVAAASLEPGSPARPLSASAHPDVQRVALAGLYRKTKPALEKALLGESESRIAILGRALKPLFEDLYDHPEHISETSVQTLLKAIQKLEPVVAAPAIPVQDSEAALKNILSSFEG